MAGTESDMTPMEAKAATSGNQDAIPARNPQDVMNKGTSDGDATENQGLAQDGMMMTSENDQSQRDMPLVSSPEPEDAISGPKRRHSPDQDAENPGSQVPPNAEGSQSQRICSAKEVHGRVMKTTHSEARLTYTGLEYNHEHHGWIPAVRHSSIRRRLIDDAAKEGRYDFEWGKGKDPDDQTAYYPKYKAWGPRREHFAAILFVYKNENYAYPDYPIRDWYDEEKIVLGPDNTPVLDWGQLPSTISYRVTGLEMEALLRHDIRLTMRDLLDRMPSMVKNEEEMQKQLKNLMSRMDMARLRQGFRCWNPFGEAGRKQNEWIDEWVPKKFRRLNDTSGWREPTEEEVAAWRRKRPKSGAVEQGRGADEEEVPETHQSRKKRKERHEPRSFLFTAMRRISSLPHGYDSEGEESKLPGCLVRCEDEEDDFGEKARFYAKAINRAERLAAEVDRWSEGSKYDLNGGEGINEEGQGRIGAR
ncbi:MAG: hypothetical protein Q9221_006355 [Calogaya cf. arnoldii]